MEEQKIEGPDVAPGWYPDPNQVQTQRFWDGARWTDQTAPLPAAEEGRDQIATPRFFIGALGAILMVVGCFLPKAEAVSLLHIANNTLMSSGDGIIFLIFGAGSLAAAYRSANSPSASWGMILLGLMTMAIVYYDGSGERIELVNGLGQHVEASAGTGIWTVGAGGLLVFLAGIRRSRGAARE